MFGTTREVVAQFAVVTRKLGDPVTMAFVADVLATKSKLAVDAKSCGKTQE
jgi:hypothetical protein